MAESGVGGCLGTPSAFQQAKSFVAKGLNKVGIGFGGPTTKPTYSTAGPKTDGPSTGSYTAAAYTPDSYTVPDPKTAAQQGGVTGYSAELDPNLNPTKYSSFGGPTTGPVGAVGPTTHSTLVGSVADEGYLTGFQAEEVKPQPPVDEGPLAELMRMTQAQERGLLRQAIICRVAVARMATLQRIMLGREKEMNAGKQADQIQEELNNWKTRTLDMQFSLAGCLNTAGKSISDLVNEKPAGSYLSVTPKDYMVSEESSAVEEVAPKPATATRPQPKKQEIKLEGPSVRTVDGKLKALDKIKVSEKKAVVPKVPDVQLSVFPQEIEKKYRVGTYHGCPVYGAVLDQTTGVYEYPADTELHLIWDVDQSKLVGEGTNDVELVIKCVLWWKEEMKHDPGFIPRSVPQDIKKEFTEFCEAFDLTQAFDSVMPLLLRPGAKEFTDAHPQAKWWTFTNKDRESQEGQVLRDVSDEDGLVGKHQAQNHDISGLPVIDANKYSLLILDEVANKHAGIQNEERPIIGVRGKRKDLARVVKLIQNKRQVNNEPASRPVTLILLDDRCQDAYGNCQANDPRILCHIPAYNAIAADKKAALIEGMEKILPVSTLLKFYNAFKQADQNHALVQCVDIMSDDQSMLMKQKKTGPNLEDTYFEYAPKVLSVPLPPPLKPFHGVPVR